MPIGSSVGKHVIEGGVKEGAARAAIHESAELAEREGGQALADLGRVAATDGAKADAAKAAENAARELAAKAEKEAAQDTAVRAAGNDVAKAAEAEGGIIRAESLETIGKSASEQLGGKIGKDAEEALKNGWADKMKTAMKGLGEGKMKNVAMLSLAAVAAIMAIGLELKMKTYDECYDNCIGQTDIPKAGFFTGIFSFGYGKKCSPHSAPCTGKSDEEAPIKGNGYSEHNCCCEPPGGTILTQDTSTKCTDLCGSNGECSDEKRNEAAFQAMIDDPLGTIKDVGKHAAEGFLDIAGGAFSFSTWFLKHGITILYVIGVIIFASIIIGVLYTLYTGTAAVGSATKAVAVARAATAKRNVANRANAFAAGTAQAVDSALGSVSLFAADATDAAAGPKGRRRSGRRRKIR